jgi:Kef-type K+ transport system membrane component KefB
VSEILSVGVILLCALAAGHLAQIIRLPEVSGYLLIGAVIGPAGLDLVSHQDREALQFLSEVALGLILFSIGLVFDMDAVRRIGRKAAAVTAAESWGAFVAVFAACTWLGVSVSAALLMATIAMETAPATTLMVLREYDARGPLTDVLTALLAFNNMLVLVTFGVVTMGISLATNTEARTIAQVYASLYGLVWGVIGSIALGAALGVVLQAWSRRANESGEVMILGIGMVLVAVGGARVLQLSPLFATLAMGATMVNASPRSDDFREALGKADPPLYAAFFVLAGAELQPSVLWTLGAVGVAYVIARAVGKTVGAWAAARRVGLPPTIRRYLGLCVLSSSSLAIGLTIQVRDQFPELAATVTGIVLAGVLVFEVIGPLATRSALVRAGEATILPRSPFVVD